MKTDLQRLQGKWAQVAFADNGIPHAADDAGFAQAVTTITGQTFHVAVLGQPTLLEGHFTLDPLHHPKRIDWIDSMGADAGKVLAAIYELQDDSFRFVAADHGMARPEDFTGGPGMTMRVFIRL